MNPRGGRQVDPIPVVNLAAMQLGAADYLEKPLRADEVASLVETHVQRHNQMARTAEAA